MDQFVAPTSLVALVLFALWAIVLVLAVGAVRFALVLRGRAKITAFPGGTQHGSDAYWRLNRAHLNTVENLPIFATIVLAGWVVGQETATFNKLGLAVIVARVVQSLIHIASGSAMAIRLRFLAYVTQIVCEIWMAVLVLQSGRLF